MTRLTLTLSALFVVACAVVGAAKLPPPPLAPEVVSVHFSPRGGCMATVVAAIDGAKHECLLMGYGFTAKPVADALIRAKARGVDVRCVLDHDAQQKKGSLAGAVARGGVAVRLDGQHAIFHDKVLIVDGDLVLTGSFNYTSAAEKSNAENLLVLRHAPTAAVYRENFLTHWGHSEPYPR